MSALASPSRYLRHSHIASCLGLALGLSSFASAASELRASTARELPHSSAGAQDTLYAIFEGSHLPTPVRQVANCNDDGPGSLRAEVAAAASGGTIDLSQLACSTITLGSRIDVLQDNLRLLGPGSDQLSIDGDAHARVIFHAGAGTLRLDGLTVTNGYYASTFGAAGGCIDSFGTVALEDSVVSNCVLVGTGTVAQGGAIFAAAGLTLISSAISGNLVSSATGKARGGAAYVVGDLYTKYSTVSRNTAYTSTYSQQVLSEAGGLFHINGDLDIRYSTISDNRSAFFAGLYAGFAYPHSGSIIASTISSNVSERGGAGATTKVPLLISNSTIAFNTSLNSFPGAGLRAYDVPLTLQSSIVADNGGPDGDSDVAGFGGLAIVTGNSAGNLIVTSNLGLPVDTIRSCPKLGPLAQNGGHTLTHAPQHDSAAIDNGNNGLNLIHDQRLAPRVVGPRADIGSVEWQTGEVDERLFAAAFDGRCDD